MRAAFIKLLLFGAIVNLARGSNIGATRQDITHYPDGGYGTLLIAINDNVPEDLSIITAIQVQVLQNALGKCVMHMHYAIYFASTM